jgi:hypothetical protein
MRRVADITYAFFPSNINLQATAHGEGGTYGTIKINNCAKNVTLSLSSQCYVASFQSCSFIMSWTKPSLGFGPSPHRYTNDRSKLMGPPASLEGQHNSMQWL